MARQPHSSAAPMPAAGHRHVLAVLSILLGATTAGPLAQAAPSTLAGVGASGRIDATFRICTTCDVVNLELFAQNAGGTGSWGSAVVNGFEVAGDDPQGSGSVDARALLAGPAGTPSLGAKAAARPGAGGLAGFSAPGAFLFSAIAEAQAAQHYTYVGPDPATYTLSVDLTGSAVNLGTGYDFLISVLGGLVLYADDGAGGIGAEGPGYGTWVDGVFLDFSASTPGADAYLASRTVSITLNPGDSFYAVARLAAYVGPDAWGVADASHTLEVAFTQGDVGLLRAALLPPTQAVPAPASAALVLLGLATLGAARRRGHQARGLRRPGLPESVKGRHVPLLAMLVLLPLGPMAHAQPADTSRLLMELQDLAAAGDAHAAERVGLMYHHGPWVYGPGVPRDVWRALHHLRIAARAGRPAAQALVEQLERENAAARDATGYVPGPAGC